jgi:hypothetical protein
VARVQFLVDGTVLAAPTREPWSAAWDTATVAAGQHTLSVRALTKDGRAAVATVVVTVAAPEPAPPPTVSQTP